MKSQLILFVLALCVLNSASEAKDRRGRTRGKPHPAALSFGMAVCASMQPPFRSFVETMHRGAELRAPKSETVQLMHPGQDPIVLQIQIDPIYFAIDAYYAAVEQKVVQIHLDSCKSVSKIEGAVELAERNRFACLDACSDLAPQFVEQNRNAAEVTKIKQQRMKNECHQTCYLHYIGYVNSLGYPDFAKFGAENIQLTLNQSKLKLNQNGLITPIKDALR